MREPVQVCYGGGRDSTAMLINQVRLVAEGKEEWRPDVITFANTGAEKRATYDFIPVFDAWLKRHGFPGVTTVQYQPVRAPYRTLEGNMVLNATLPGAALNQHTCAMKFKVEPQQTWARRNWKQAREAWAAGLQVRKLIGFEAGEKDRLKRADARALTKVDKLEAKRYRVEYPLMDWGIDLAECIEIIRRAGLPVPPKSACYFCPYQQTHEVDEATPEDRARTILIELVAEPYNRKVRGLWRQPRKRDGREGSITEYILRKKLDFVPLESIAPVVVLNEKCHKANAGETFHGPHVGPTLREQLEAAGHFAPPVVTAGQWPGDGAVYAEDLRVPLAAPVEDEQHAELIAAA